MRKQWMIGAAVICGLAAGAAIAQLAGGQRREHENPSQVPPKVKAAVAKYSKGSRSVEIERASEGAMTVYKAEWKHLNHENRATVTSDGELVSLEEHLETREVPSTIAEAAKARFPNQPNLAFVRKTTVNFEVLTTVDGKRQAVAISPVGKAGEARDVQAGEYEDDEKEGGDHDDRRPGARSPMSGAQQGQGAGTGQSVSPGSRIKQSIPGR